MIEAGLVRNDGLSDRRDICSLIKCYSSLNFYKFKLTRQEIQVINESMEAEARMQEERKRERRRMDAIEWTDRVVSNIDLSDKPKSWEESVAQSFNQTPRPRGTFRRVGVTPTLRGVSPDGRC